MRKLYFLPPVLMLIAGIFGAKLRQIEIDMVFDYATGLAHPMASETINLALLSAAAVIFAVIAAVLIPRGRAALRGYSEAFHISSFFVFTLYALLGGAVSVTSGLWFASYMSSHDMFNVNDMFLMLMSFLSGISLITGAVCGFTRKNVPAMRFFGVIPSLFFCLWLLDIYTANRTNPVLLDFVLPCFGYASACLGFFYSAGYVYDRSSPRLTLLFALFGIYFCTASLPDSPGDFELLLTIFFISTQVFNAAIFSKNLCTSQKNKTA